MPPGRPFRPKRVRDRRLLTDITAGFTPCGAPLYFIRPKVPPRRANNDLRMFDEQEVLYFMKALHRFLIIASILVAGTVVANAQLEPSSAITVDVPMSFTVNGKAFPSGTYHITRMVTFTPSSALVMRGDGGSIVFNTSAGRLAREPRRTHLVFDWVNGGYMLSRIAVGGTNTAFDLRKTSEQRETISQRRRAQRIVNASDTGF